MLWTRLAVGALCVAGGAATSTFIAQDDGRTAGRLGALFLVLSLPDHLYHVWADYPPWYHATYLAYLLPIGVVTGRLSARCRSAGTGRATCGVLG